jgi:uncharacterized protein YxjI
MDADYINMPPPPSVAAAPAAADQRFAQSEYIIRRRIMVLLGSAIDVQDGAGRQALFCQGKAFRLKEDLRIYADETKKQELLSVQARQVLDFSGAYDVTDRVTGELVGTMRRRGLKSIIKDHWDFLDPSGNVIGSLEEDNMALALVRRFLTDLVPQSYDIRSADGRLLAEANQFFNPFQYKMRLRFLDQGATTRLDRRLVLAACMLLCTVEGRQSS